jgi:2-iminoacetate synthase
MKEYLEDYASPGTKKTGEALIKKELEKIPNEKIKMLVEENLVKISGGMRDFRL